MSVVRCITRLVFSSIFSYIISHYHYKYEDKLLLQAFMTWDFHSFIPVIVQIVSGLVAFIALWTACSTCLNRVCFAVPILLLPITASIYEFFKCSEILHYFLYDQTTCRALESTFSYHRILVGCLLWLSSVITANHIWIKIPSSASFSLLERDIWNYPGFDCLFVGQSFSFNRSRETLKQIVKSKSGKVIHILITVYRETEEEIMTSLNAAQRLTSEQTNKSKHEYIIHFVWDNAFDPKLNTSLVPLESLLRQYSDITETEKCYYGEVISGNLRKNKIKFYLHKKNCSAVRQRKRWSQIILLEYLLCNLKCDVEREFLLMLDCDTDFTREAIDSMVAVMRDKRIGAVCGKIEPSGSSMFNPIVWFQKFEYASAHWLQKSAEHIFGTVLCSPGCFSLFKIQALVSSFNAYGNITPGKSPIEEYARITKEPFELLMYDLGEDRMLSTILIKNGWTILYESTAVAQTHCPESFDVLFVQRRRWISSTLANTMHIISVSKEICSSNPTVSLFYVIYTASLFLISLITPAFVVIVTFGGLAAAFPEHAALAYTIAIGFPTIFIIICMLFPTSPTRPANLKLQLRAAKILSNLYILLIFVVVVGVSLQLTAHQAKTSKYPEFIYLGSLASFYVIGAILHGDLPILGYGLAYLIFLPMMYLILFIFAIANMHDYSWGTREEEEGGKTIKGAIKLFFEDLKTCCTDDTNGNTKIPSTPRIPNASTENVNVPDKKGMEPTIAIIPPDRNCISSDSGPGSKKEEENPQSKQIQIGTKLSKAASEKDDKQAIMKLESELISLRNVVSWSFLLINTGCLILVFLLDKFIKKLSLLEGVNSALLLILIIGGSTTAIQFLGMLNYWWNSIQKKISKTKMTGTCLTEIGTENLREPLGSTVVAEKKITDKYCWML